MARKTFEDNHRIAFNREPDVTRQPSLIPEMTCDEASAGFGELKAKGRISIADLLRVMKHLASDEIPHQVSCQFHQAGSLDHVRRRFREIMNGEG